MTSDGGAPMDPDRVAVRLAYARWLLIFTRAGMGFLAGAFVLYLSGALPAGVTPQAVAGAWHLPLRDYLAATAAPTGWSWATHLNRADALGLAGIAWLAGCSAVALVLATPMFAARGERVQVALALAQVAVLLLAALGVGGAH